MNSARIKIDVGPAVVQVNNSHGSRCAAVEFEYPKATWNSSRSYSKNRTSGAWTAALKTSYTLHYMITIHERV